MKLPLLHSMQAYWIRIFDEIRSVWSSCLTTLSYLFSKGDLYKEVTEQYPDPISSRTPEDLPARSRGLLLNQIDLCTACGDCVKVCPTGCIRIETEDEPAHDSDFGKDENKIWISYFEVDFAKCIFCGLCSEACQPGALVHTRQYEGAVYRLTDLKVNFGRGPVERFEP